ncbi:hypothetical protein V8F20_000939 [Naviculisporaceae sp. PSN 640]
MVNLEYFFKTIFDTLYILATPLYHLETLIFNLLCLPTDRSMTFRMFPTIPSGGNPDADYLAHITRYLHSLSLIFLLLFPQMLPSGRRREPEGNELAAIFRKLGWVKPGGAKTKTTRELVLEYGLTLFRVWLGCAWVNFFFPQAVLSFSSRATVWSLPSAFMMFFGGILILG